MPIARNIQKEYDFDIGIEDYELYLMFYKLHDRISHYRPFDDGKVDKTFRRYDQNDEYPLVKNNIITWRSDDDLVEDAPYVQISKHKDNFHLHFQSGKHPSGLYANSIRFSTSGSRYHSFYVPFMELYAEIKEKEFEPHQYSIYEYVKTLK